jgi:hypothetical protein
VSTQLFNFSFGVHNAGALLRCFLRGLLSHFSSDVGGI